jgi:KDO2-lipid IV(A) lauroyltransferase
MREDLAWGRVPDARFIHLDAARTHRRGRVTARVLATDGLFWRRLAHAGASRGPEWFRRYAPPLFGLAFAAALPNVRHAIASNLRRVRGDTGRVREAIDVARTFASYASCLAEALGGDALEPPRAVVLGERHLENALREGRGAVFATAHTGGWEMAGPLLRRDRGLELVMVMQRERDADARRIQDGARAERGVRIVHVGEDPLESLPLLRHLRSGGIVALQVDRAVGARVVPVQLFGERATLPEGPLRLAQLSGAPLLPIFAARTGHRAYVVRAYEPIHLERRATPAALESAAQRLADAMAAFIFEHPTQWFHFHP